MRAERDHCSPFSDITALTALIVGGDMEIAWLKDPDGNTLNIVSG